MQRLLSGAFADQVDLATGVRGTVQHRTGATQHLDALQAIGLWCVPAEKLWQEGTGAVT
ncbi:hypothetical protein D3C76_1745180 [compost metagenome]